MGHNIQVGDRIFEGIENIAARNTDGTMVNFLNPEGGEASSLQWATGFIDCTAGQSFRVENLPFTPKGYAFMLCGDTTDNVNFTDSTNCLLYCLYDTITNTERRVIGQSSGYTVRVNPLTSSNFTVFAGGFEQIASSNEIYNVMEQRYFWIAWG